MLNLEWYLFVVLVKKKNNIYWFVCDYRVLNKIIVLMLFLLFYIESVFDIIGEVKVVYFINLDLMLGFW